MKKYSLTTIACAAMLAWNAGAAPANTDSDVSVQVSADTLTVEVSKTGTVSKTDTMTTATKTAETSPALPSPFYFGEDGELRVTTTDGSLTVDEIVEEYNYLISSRQDRDFTPDQWSLVAIVGICFGVPGLVVIIALILILGFQRRKNRERNDIIRHAIDNNYSLPDAFYNRQSLYSNGESNSLPNNPGASPVFRDVRKLTSAITLCAVGLALLIAFLCVDHTWLAFVAGGIPLFIGVGRLVAYYTVPGYANFPMNNNQQYGPIYPGGHIHNMPPIPPDYNANNYRQQPTQPMNERPSGHLGHNYGPNPNH